MISSILQLTFLIFGVSVLTPIFGTIEFGVLKTTLTALAIGGLSFGLVLTFLKLFTSLISMKKITLIYHLIILALYITLILIYVI